MFHNFPKHVTVSGPYDIWNPVYIYYLLIYSKNDPYLIKIIASKSALDNKYDFTNYIWCNPK